MRTEAVYRRRRLGALAFGALALVAFLLGVRSGSGSGDDATISGQSSNDSEAEARRQALAENPTRMTLSFSGDLLIHSPVFLRAQQLAGGSGYRFEPMLERLRPYVKKPDLSICHVETPMSPDAPPAGYPLFNAPPELAGAIKATGWDACDTASNHTLDLGQAGVEATIKTLRKAGVEQTGSYASARAQKKPLILDQGSARIALLSYTTDTNGIPLPEPYSVNVASDPKQVIADARRARADGADAVFVTMAWGSDLAPEYMAEPSEAVRRFARRLAAADEITAIAGHGPHVVQPIERIKGKVVIFSSGNLISNQSAACCAEASQDGLIAQLDLVIDGDGDRVESARYVPIYVSQPDYNVLPVGDALESGEGDPASLQASYERTVSVAGRDAAEPIPKRIG